MQTGSPFRLEIEHKVEVPKAHAVKAEFILLKMFGDYRIGSVAPDFGNPSSKQEWFYFTEEQAERCIEEMDRIGGEIAERGVEALADTTRDYYKHD